ncbi:RNA polymerase sigma factor [Streptomyces sp. NPDC090445]|uniref:RNA polymerase sigma factor n=1 Tax=Streptomyces sp. NPDC090445 TaxID=3365963 RepID=UPI0037F15CEB
MQEIRTQRAEEFRCLAREQLPRLYSIARALVGEDAEDAVQECLLKAFQRYGQLHDAAAGPAWLRKILVNCCRDFGRAKARQPVQVHFDEAEEFSLYRKIAYEDPFPYSDSLHLDRVRLPRLQPHLLETPQQARIMIVLRALRNSAAASLWPWSIRRWTSPTASSRWRKNLDTGQCALRTKRLASCAIWTRSCRPRSINRASANVSVYPPCGMPVCGSVPAAGRGVRPTGADIHATALPHPEGAFGGSGVGPLLAALSR